jgi:hypothetical protein
MMFGLEPETIRLWSAWFSLVGAVAGCVAAVISARNRIINRRARAAADLAAETSKESVTILRETIQRMMRANDDMLAAVATSQSLSLRLARIERYLADHEVDLATRERLEQPTRAIPTSGGTYLPTR